MVTKEVEKHGSRNIKLGTILGYINLVLSISTGLLYTPWIKNTIGVGNYGLYTLSTSLINLFLLDFGLSSTINTFLSRYRAAEDEESIKGFLGVVYKIFFIIDFFVFASFLLVYFFIDVIYGGLTAQEILEFKKIFLVAALFSVVSFPCTVFTGVLQSYEEFIAIKIIDIVHRLSYIAVSAFALSFGWGLFGLVLANFGTAAFSHLLRWVAIQFKIKIRANFRFKPDRTFVKSILFYSVWATIQSIAARLVFNVMPSILGIISDSENIAVFGFIASLEGYIYSFGAVLSGFFIPKIARLLEQEDAKEKIELFAIKVGKIQLAVIGLIFSGFLCCGHEFVLLWLSGDPYSFTVYWGTTLIVSYHLVFIPQMVFTNAMYLTDHVKELSIGAILKALLNVVLAFWLGAIYGAAGAAVSVFISRIFELCFNNIAYKLILKISLYKYFAKVYLPMTPALCLSAFAGLLLHFYLPFSTLINFLIIGFSVVIIFSALVFLIGLSKDEKKVILGALIKRKNK